MDHSQDKTKERLRWACRRGMLELDIFLMNFLEKDYENLTLNEKQGFSELLKEKDPDLFAWLMGHQIPNNKEYQSLVTKIRSAQKRPD